ncbi:hypothetical protein M569_15728 [Genlisea aurea]|uniref:Uncharacterized protein n=1 Tax=Genlisea aurea TaxID=192259 RepID=S8DI44_9LAMI|nr:hypothetical protein M569_15728 [Genlisea aurea]
MARSGDEKCSIERGSDFRRIEELIKLNNFSREEISRLVEILNSRAANESENHESGGNNGKDAHQVVSMDEIQGTPYQEKRPDIHRAYNAAFHENAEVPDEVFATPIDIARAYMAGCASERDHDNSNFKSKIEQAKRSNDFTWKKPFLSSPSPKPSMCEPGAVLHDHPSTPQYERARHRIHELARTPYSRSIMSKSSSKSNSMVESVDASRSGGPIHRIRSRFASEIRPGASVFSSSAKQLSSINGTPHALEGSSVFRKQDAPGPNETKGALKNLPGDDSSEHPSLSSSRTVRAILEHLDRNKPTPKEKEAELQLLTSWRESPSREDNSTHHIAEPPLENGPGTRRSDISGEISKNGGSGFLIGSNNILEVVKNAGKGKAVPSDTQFDTVHGPDIGASSFIHASSSSSVDKNSNEIQLFFVYNELTDFVSLQQAMLFGSLSRYERGPKIHGAKQSLPSLSIDKRASSQNESVFSFPVSTSSALSSGLVSDPPPTPSLIPSSSSAVIPSYSFGANTQRLAFMFPSTGDSNESKTSEVSIPVFGFGSSDGDASRLCFGSVGKDGGVCF